MRRADRRLVATACALTIAATIGWRAQEPSARRGTIDLTIGGENETRIEYSFTSVSAIITDSTGRIFVSDRKEHTVRVYSPAGVHLFDIGRQGQGPGDLKEPSTIAFDRGGHLWVRDGGNLRYVGFTVLRDRATPYATRRMAHSSGTLWAPLTFDPAGNLIDIGNVHVQTTAYPITVRFHLDANSVVVSADTVPTPRADSTPMFIDTRTTKRPDGSTSTTTNYLPQPYGGIALQAHSVTGEWVSAASSGYMIAWHDARGRMVRQVTRSVAPPPVLSAANRKSGQQRIDDFVKEVGVARSAIPFGIPERKAPLRELAFDAEGRLWVERATVTGTPRLADVFGRDGRYLATVTWPAEVQLLGYGMARGWTAFGLASDSLGIQRVVRVTLKE